MRKYAGTVWRKKIVEVNGSITNIPNCIYVIQEDVWLNDTGLLSPLSNAESQPYYYALVSLYDRIL